MNNLSKFFHALIFIIMIVHTSICSLLFEGTAIWNILTYFCEFSFIVVLCQYIKRITIRNSIEKLSIAYFILILIVSIIYSLDSSNIISLFGRAIEVATILMIFRLNQDNCLFLLYSAAITLSLCVYANAYFLMLFPEGFPNYFGEHPFYFLGTNYNQIGPKVIMAYMFTAILFEKNRFFFLNMILLSITGIWTLITVNSMTSAVSFILLIIVILFSKKVLIKKAFTYGLLIFIIIFQVFVVFIGSSFNGSLLTRFLDYIGKDSTFTGRTELWAYSGEYFLDSPIWGHGYVSPVDYAHNGYFHGREQGSHNYIYFTLHKGGVLLLILVYSLFKKGYQKIRGYLKYNTAYAIVFTCIVFFLMMLFEYYDVLFIFLLIALMYYYPNIHPLLNNKNK